MEYFSEFGYAGMFLAAFLAATILPLSSEVVLTALLVTGLSPTGVVAVATTGNVLGSFLNYALGYWVSIEVVRRWLKMSEAEFAQAEKRFEKYGLAALLLAWVPVIGDPITVVAGVLRVRLAWFFILVTIGKLARYVVLAYITVKAS